MTYWSVVVVGALVKPGLYYMSVIKESGAAVLSARGDDGQTGTAG